MKDTNKNVYMRFAWKILGKMMSAYGVLESLGQLFQLFYLLNMCVYMLTSVYSNFPYDFSKRP